MFIKKFKIYKTSQIVWNLKSPDNKQNQMPNTVHYSEGLFLQVEEFFETIEHRY